MMSVRFVRGIATRSKKVTVQLLQDFEGTGVRGEVLDVAEGFMRNRLQPGNGACYVVDGITRIPRVSPVRAPRKVRTEPYEDTNDPTKIEREQLSILDLLRFSSSKSGNEADPSGKYTETNSEEFRDKPQFDWENQLIKKLRE